MRKQRQAARWFAGSRVIDGRGQPLVVYHGTIAEFSEFELTDDIGFHFGSLDAAEARLRDIAGGSGFEEGSNVRPVVLAIRNPLRIPDQFTWSPRTMACLLFDLGVISAEERDETEIIDREFVARVMKRAGYDGFVYHNSTEGEGDSWIALEARQIRPWWELARGN